MSLLSFLANQEFLWGVDATRGVVRCGALPSDFIKSVTAKHDVLKNQSDAETKRRVP